MPPQQAYGLLDFVDNVLRFGAHGGRCSLYGCDDPVDWRDT
jgi:hypothetical protein